jgi:Tfp pilus tip-associated adhesin PilY1
MKRFTIALLAALVVTVGHHQAMAQTMNSYSAYPPFINKSVPPAVMLMMTKDHRLFLKGYNDIVDLDNGTPGGDAAIDTTYKDNIDYVGYFDPKKCYDYASSGGAGFANTGRFNPAAAGTGTYGHYCTAKWSGNFLNWATMARIDIIRKVLYGGRRILDGAGSAASLGIVSPTVYGMTVLGRTMTPRDAHSWAKPYAGADLASLVPTAALGIGAAVTICNTNSAATETVGMMMVLNGNFPDADSTETYQCHKTDNAAGADFTTGAGNQWITTYRVAVKVCDTTVSLESDCDVYYDDNTPSPTNVYTYKPQGLLQRMAVNANGSAGTSDDTITMRFGLISGSYNKNFSGGVLRSKITDLYSQEINRRTGQISSTSKVIKTIDMFRVMGYSFSSGYSGASPEDGCNPSGSVPAEGTCRSWGEPFSEMFYEAIRYFRGLAATGSATTQFYAASPDNGIQSYAIGDGAANPVLSNFPVEASGSYGDPYVTVPVVCEYCAKPFVLMFGDAFPSHDSDQLPGAQAWTQAPSQVNPTTNDTGLSMSTLLTNSQMDTLDPITSVIVGDIGGTTDSLCSAKATTTYLNIRGLCPEEPGKYGTYYLPMLAHYAKTTDLRGALGNDTTNSVKQSITTYAVVASAPVPILEFTVGGKKVQLNPAFHSGCPAAAGAAPGSDPNRFAGCAAAGTGGWSPPSATYKGNKGELVSFEICANNDEAVNGYTSCYEIMFNDATYGGDWDLDLRYRLYVKTTATNIMVKTKPVYAASGNGNWAGYNINGVSGGNVTADPTSATGGGALSNTGSGEYYDIRCGAGITGNSVGCQRYFGNPVVAQTVPYSLAVERTFTVTGSNAGLLKDPLWYASKYGGFKDSDKVSTTGYNLPDKTAEWDANGDGLPDTYFFAQNPLELEGKLAAAFAAILNQTSSGTAASVLSSSTTGEGAIYQSYFYPTQFEAEREIKYAGYTQSLFVDTYGNFREDTVKDNRLVLTEDRIVVTRYDSLNDRLAIDIYVDANGDGKADPTRDTSVPPDGILDTAFCDDAPHQCDKILADINPIWEGGRNLALMSPSSRTIFTWVDLDNNKLVKNIAPPTGAATEEYIVFDSTNVNKLTGYLNLSGAPAAYTAANIIDFIRGTQVTGLRDRTLTVKDLSGSPVSAVWKLGDSVYSTPVVVGAPRERYDLLYGDSTYTAFYSLYKNRRQVAYLGANDGMMHAFNVGFYNQGDDTVGTPAKIEHGWFSNTSTADGRGVNIGDELWGFIPQELLPHLRWLADPSYTHVYYVDLKPKVTDVRIFTPDADHPGGWGTILIGGFRMGGSCGICTTQGQKMNFAADFNGDSVADAARTFLSSYFVLDVTNPDKVPTLLWSFSDQNLGFTTSYPAVARVSPLGDLKTDNTNAQWLMVVGSGPTSYDAGVGQTGKMFAVNIKSRMTSTAAGVVTMFDASGGGATPPNSFVGDLVAFDRDLDYRTDVIFGGKVISAAPWEGKLIRLTTGCWKPSSPVCNTDPSLWGVPSGTVGVQAPSEILYQFLDGGGTTKTLGPVPAAVGVAIDQTGNTWVFAGTGRYYTQTSGTGDKIDTSVQYLVGIKDSVMQGSGGCVGGDVTITGCRLSSTLSDELIDMSTATICQLGSGTCTGTGVNQQVTSVPAMAAGGTYASLMSLVQSKKGWFTKLTVPGGGLPSERSVANPVVLGGIVFFPTFTPSGDVCVAAGASNLYGLYYVTGGAYSSPVLGMTGQNINSKTSLGEGLATTVAIHLGAQGDGTTGAGSNTGVKACSQSSTGAINCVNTGTASAVASHFLSWINQRD